MRDRIFLEALDIQGVIGIYDWERKIKQTIRIDLEMPANAAYASGSDQIEDTLNYKDVAKRVIAYVEESGYQLVETLAEKISTLILDEFHVQWVSLSVSKPGAVTGSKNVGIKVFRGVDESSTGRDVFVALGSNIHPNKNLKKAMALLVDRFGALCQSTVYQNRAVGFEGDDFLNLVASFHTTEDLAAIKTACAEIEDQCGRDRGVEKFAPRTIDIDLLLFGDVIMNSKQAQLPRSEISKFPFMLRPLAELAGNRRHPVTGETFAQMWRQFSGNDHPMQPVNL